MCCGTYSFIVDEKCYTYCCCARCCCVYERKFRRVQATLRWRAQFTIDPDDHIHARSRESSSLSLFSFNFILNTHIAKCVYLSVGCILAHGCWPFRDAIALTAKLSLSLSLSRATVIITQEPFFYHFLVVLYSFLC